MTHQGKHYVNANKELWQTAKLKTKPRMIFIQGHTTEKIA